MKYPKKLTKWTINTSYNKPVLYCYICSEKNYNIMQRAVTSEGYLLLNNPHEPIWIVTAALTPRMCQCPSPGKLLVRGWTE